MLAAITIKLGLNFPVYVPFRTIYMTTHKAMRPSAWSVCVCERVCACAVANGKKSTVHETFSFSGRFGCSNLE